MLGILYWLGALLLILAVIIGWGLYICIKKKGDMLDIGATTVAIIFFIVLAIPFVCMLSSMHDQVKVVITEIDGTEHVFIGDRYLVDDSDDITVRIYSKESSDWVEYRNLKKVVLSYME